MTREASTRKRGNLSAGQIARDSRKVKPPLWVPTPTRLFDSRQPAGCTQCQHAAYEGMPVASSQQHRLEARRAGVARGIGITFTVS